MSDITRLVALTEQSTKENNELKQQNVALMQKISELLASVNVSGQLQAEANVNGGLRVRVDPSEDDIRREKISKLYMNLKKSQKVKDYKENSQENVQEWLCKFDLECENIAKMTCNLNLTAKPFSNEEYVSCVKEKLDYSAIKRLNSAFETQENVTNWGNITKKKLRELIVAEFGNKEPDVSSVLACFGPDRLKKDKDMKVSKFYQIWREQLPDCLQPKTNDEFRKCVDLVQRCIFYQGLNDRYLQEQLCNIKSDNLSLKQFFDEAVLAEAKKRTFENTTEKSNNLDPDTSASVNKTEYPI